MFNIMSDELKKVKRLKKITDFKGLIIKYFKEIKRLERLQKAEAYLESERISLMEILCGYN